MMNHLLIIGLCCFMLMTSSCGISSNHLSSKSQPPIIEMSRGACFGQCPIYRLTIYDDGTALYEGKRFTDRLGIYRRGLTEKEMKALRHNLTNLRWDDYNTYYESRLPDLQMTTLTRGQYTVKFKEESPIELRVVGDLLNSYAEKGDWVKLSANGGDPDYIQNEITVQLKPGITAETLLASLELPSLNINKVVSDSMNTWLFNYDNKMISPGQLYYALINNKNVLNAEFNIQLKLRNE